MPTKTEVSSGSMEGQQVQVQALQETPLHAHDCEHCVFLGRFDSDYRDGKTQTFDLYYHAPSNKFPLDETVIARFGSGAAYYSGMHFAQPYTSITGAEHEGIPMLVEAMRRALARATGEAA